MITFKQWWDSLGETLPKDAVAKMELAWNAATKEQRFNLSPQELANLCTFSFGMSCDAPEDAMPVTIGYLPAHESGPGWYVWGEEYPEEGSVPLLLPR